MLAKSCSFLKSSEYQRFCFNLPLYFFLSGGKVQCCLFFDMVLFSVSIRMDNFYFVVLSTFALYKGAFFLEVSTCTCPKPIFSVVIKTVK